MRRMNRLLGAACAGRVHASSAAAAALSTAEAKLVSQAVQFLEKDAADGGLKIGKLFCATFGISPPARETAIDYHKLLKKVVPQYKAKVPAAAKKTRRNELWESPHSCFKRTPELHARNEELIQKYRRFLVLDFETTTKSKHRRTASPFTSENRVVYTASRRSGDSKATVDGPFAERDTYRTQFPSLEDVDVIVGHNVKFDLLYIWGDAALKKFFRRGGLVWDTMYAEYLRNGHKDGERHSLDHLSLLYGGEIKDQYIKQQWDAGIDTPAIDPAKMRSYAAADVDNTMLIFEQQLQFFYEAQRLPLVLTHMEGLLATTEMEYNGIYVRDDIASEMNDALLKEAEKLEDEVRTAYTPPEIVQFNKEQEGIAKDPITFNWASSTQLKAYLFGGKCSYKAQVPDGKKGRLVWKQFAIEFAGIVPQAWRDTNERRFATNGNWKVSDDVISSIADAYAEEKWAAAISKLRSIKKNRKLSSTYLGALASLIDDRNILHPQLNHIVTRTGRLSSSNPNMQNVPRGDKSNVKKCLQTRFINPKTKEPEGVMIESDYSQLEVFVQALLSQDSTLMEELEHGADLHCKRLARMKNMPYAEVLKLCKVDKDPAWTNQRTKAKVFSFQRQYGAGNRMIAQTTGMDIEEVALLVEKEKEAYPLVEAFFDRVTKALKDTSSATGRDEGWYDAPSGNRWYFEAVPVNSRYGAKLQSGDRKEFRRQLVLNHPVQGYAAEIVFMCLGKLWRYFLENGNFSATGDFDSEGRALMVNTVHDCVWVDARDEVRDEVAKAVERILSDVKGAYSDTGYTIPKWLDFKTETSWGISMAEV
ncbi:DNA polymerase I [Diplonema papillatum]|nr:DNA polymerase I [Diplonema papillatum]